MMKVNLINCVVDLRDSSNFSTLDNLLSSIVAYDQWTFDFSTDTLTVWIPEGTEVSDWSTVGEVIE